jgi:hypothetical protein
MMKTYNAAGGASTGTTGFTNFVGKSNNEGALAAVFADFPDAVVLDGSDDWYSNPLSRPSDICREMEIKPLALYHSGISGIAKSGVVIRFEDFERLADEGLGHVSERIIKDAYKSTNSTAKKWGHECLMDKVFRLSAYSREDNMVVEISGKSGLFSVKQRELEKQSSQDMGR